MKQHRASVHAWRGAWRWLLPLAALLSSGCSTIQLAYNHLDTLVQWKVDDYIDFDDVQQKQFDQDFDVLWTWHRHTQLVLYAEDLRAIADAVDKPLSPAQVDQWITRSEEHGKIVAQRAEAPTAALLATLSDAQVQHLIKRMDKDRDKRAEKLADHTPKERREKRGKKMRDTLEDWLGDLNDAQARRVHDWAAQRRPTADLGLTVYRTWNKRFASVLATRGQPGFEKRFATLFTNDVSDDQRRLDTFNQANRDNWVSLISDLSAGLSTNQRRHLQRRLRSTADDLQQLATKR